MTAGRTLGICAVAMALTVHRADGQDLSRYRDFVLESDIASVTTLTAAISPDVRTLHRRPALLQEMTWRPARWVAGSTAATTDPVDTIVFRFYEDQLFGIVVDYRSDRTEGMTNADLIEAIAAVYGTPAPRPPSAGRVPSRLEIDSGTPIAWWTDTTRMVVLYRTASSRRVFRLIATVPRLDALAKTATAEAVRLDVQEAPTRELAREKQERDEARSAADKARVTNKGTFRP